MNFPGRCSGPPPVWHTCGPGICNSGNRGRMRQQRPRTSIAENSEAPVHFSGGIGRSQPQRYGARRHPVAVANNTQPQTTHASSAPGSAIAGFYFDGRRYFRIAPNNAGLNAYTNQDMEMRRRENERLEMMETTDSFETTASSPSLAQCVSKRKMPRPGSAIPNVLAAQQLGNVSGHNYSCFVNERRVRAAPRQPTTVCNVMGGDRPDVNLERCMFLNASGDGKLALGCWSVRQSPWGTRIMCLQVDATSSRANERQFGLSVRPTDNFICTVDQKVADMCQAKMDSSVTCILYVTSPVPPTRGSRIFLQPLPEMSNICDQEFLESPIYNAHWGMTEGVWSCAWEPRHMRVSLGLERCGMIMDVVAEKDFKLYSRHKNVLTQRFSKDGNLLYMGLRSGDILCCDLRLTHHHTIFALPQRCTCSISLMNDNNYLIAANYFGEVNLWDVRQNRVVQSFSGLRNSYTRTPIVVSEDETIALAVGEDGTTKGWSLRTGETLCTIPAPYPVPDRHSMPHLSYSNRWGGRYGNAAVALAVRDELHFYELTAL